MAIPGAGSSGRLPLLEPSHERGASAHQDHSSPPGQPPVAPSRRPLDLPDPDPPEANAELSQLPVPAYEIMQPKRTAKPYGYHSSAGTAARKMGLPALSWEDAMSYAIHLLDTFPHTSNLGVGVLVATIDALHDGARACIAPTPTRTRTSKTCPSWSSASGCAWTAPTSAPPPSGSQAAGPSTTPTSPSRCWRPARPPVRAVATNGSGMPRGMSTAGSAPRPAGAVSSPAGNSWPP